MTVKTTVISVKKATKVITVKTTKNLIVFNCPIKKN